MLELHDVLVLVLADVVEDGVSSLLAEGVSHHVHLVLSLVTDVVDGVLNAPHRSDGGHLAVCFGAQKPVNAWPKNLTLHPTPLHPLMYYL